MSHLATAAKLILFLLLLSFALKNSEVVPLRYYFGVEWHIPLSLALLVAFAIGLLIGLLAMSLKLIRSRRELAGLRRAQHAAPRQTQP